MSEAELSAVSIKALSSDTRKTISSFLNVENNFLSQNGIAQDWRGLAELLDFDYREIRNLKRYEDPTSKVLQMWGNGSNATIGEFLNILKKMERGDILLQCLPLIESDVNKYLKMQKPVQVSVVTSCAPVCLNPKERTVSAPDANIREESCMPTELRPNDRDVLTTDDASNGECNTYDAYMCHADEDLGFVLKLTHYLEEYNLKVFLPSRNLLSGHMQEVALIKLIKERCARMLVILSPAFSESPSCIFQANFAASLQIEDMKRITIPIIIAPCQVPLILSTLSKVDFTKNNEIVQKWILPKLVYSIKKVENSPFLFQGNKDTANRIDKSTQNEALSSVQNNLAIEFPLSANNLDSSQDVSALVFESNSSACSSSAVASFNTPTSELPEQSMTIAAATKPFIKHSKNTHATSEDNVSVHRYSRRNFFKESFCALIERFSKNNQSSSQVTSCTNDITGFRN